MPEVQGLEPNPPAATDWVEMEQSGIDGTFKCAPSAVGHWERRGWSVKGRAEAPVNAAHVVAAESPAETPQPDVATGAEQVQVTPVEQPTEPVPAPAVDAPSPARRR